MGKSQWHMRHVLTILMLTFAMVSCTSHRKDIHCILPDGVILHTGDVVFRLGGGLESHAVLSLDVHGKYSHVGIVVDTMGRKMIVHAVPGEPDFEGDLDRVKLDDVSRFFSSLYANRGEVMRMSDSVVAGNAAQKALELFRRNVLFDDDYNVGDTTRMYCTELVMYAYSRAGEELVTVSPHHISLPLLSADVYYPSDIYESGKLKSIIQF